MQKPSTVSIKARVFRSNGLWYTLVDETNKTWSGRLKGKIRTIEIKANNPIAIGDWVLAEPEPNHPNQAVITEIVERQNYIIRRSAHKKGHAHLLASNVDQCALIITLHTPRTSWGFVDRFLVSCETFRIPALLILNKQDLYDEEDLAQVARFREIYEPLGYRVMLTAVPNLVGIAALKDSLKNKTTLFSGHSGVGKSSLLNVLYPGVNQSTGAVSDFSDKGTHTTTFAEMFEPESGVILIDTPGIKELGVFEIGEAELSHYFPEMRSYLNACRFHDCRHLTEPGCAVHKAIEEGIIAMERYKNYLSILSEDEQKR
jgi:ribosome biogenesis GTPase